MSWEAAITALEAHMVTATSTYQYTQLAGEPGTPPKKTVCWYITGVGDNPHIPETLDDHPFGDFVSIRFYIPVATRAGTTSRKVEMELRDVTRRLIAALELDRSLGGNVVSLTINDADAGWLTVDNGWWRVSTVPLILGFTDEEPIAEGGVLAPFVDPPTATPEAIALSLISVDFLDDVVPAASYTAESLAIAILALGLLAPGSVTPATVTPEALALALIAAGVMAAS
jgi:hypothetical protein